MADLLSFVMLLAAAGIVLDSPAIAELMKTPEGQQEFWAYLINNSVALRAEWNLDWPLFLITMTGICAIWVLSRKRRKPMAGKPLSTLYPDLPLPDNLRDRKIVLSDQSVVTRDTIFVSMPIARLARTNVEHFFFFLQHEWFHHRTGDAALVPFATYLGKVSAVFLSAYLGGLVIPFLIPLNWLDELPVMKILAVILIAVLGFSATYRLFKYDTGRFQYLKEQLADGFAATRTGVVPSTLFLDETPSRASPFLDSTPAAAERRDFLAHGRTDQPVALLSILICKWAMVRTVALIVAANPILAIPGVILIDCMLLPALAPIVLSAWRLRAERFSAVSRWAPALAALLLLAGFPMWLAFILNSLPTGVPDSSTWTAAHFLLALPTLPTLVLIVFVAGLAGRRFRSGKP
ncbi:hypothetical protein [Skermanella pratensis]|uniref:hypothetical protein n=1 Tax=Skermanella pratensis TaxID=2233999 RepID=UPI001787834A|nr:hypothetical protein [Skermanella pratensis]